MSSTPSTNFAYLAHHDARLVALATQAEEHFAADPATTLVKLRLFGEILAQRAAAKVGVARLRKTRKFTDQQAEWLGRIATQIKHETVVDKASFDERQFRTEGGFARMNKVFDGSLEALLGDLADEVWKDAG